MIFVSGGADLQEISKRAGDPTWTTATSGEFKFAKGSPEPLTQVGSEGYAGEVVAPATGRMAVFAKLRFDDFILTTGITFIP